MAPYVKVLVQNIKAARARADLDQSDVVDRMRFLGFDTWHRQTMGKVERAERKVTAEEVLGLAACLNTTVQYLMSPDLHDEPVQLPSGESWDAGQVRSLVFGLSGVEIRGTSVRDARDVRGIRWNGNKLEVGES